MHELFRILALCGFVVGAGIIALAFATVLINLIAGGFGKHPKLLSTKSKVTSTQPQAVKPQGASHASHSRR